MMTALSYQSTLTRFPSRCASRGLSEGLYTFDLFLLRGWWSFNAELVVDVEEGVGESVEGEESGL